MNKDTLEEINKRYQDCLTYNFGMSNANKLAHKDVLYLLTELMKAQNALADAWERGMADAKMQALGIRPLVKNPYLEEEEVKNENS